MPHNLSSARGTVLKPEDEAPKTANNPVGHIHIVGGIIGLVALLVFIVVFSL